MRVGIDGSFMLPSVLKAALFTCTLSAGYAAAAESLGVHGKEDWLYYRYELSSAADAAATNVSMDLIRRFNKVLAGNGIQLVVAIVPLKMRVYPEYLPDSIKVNDYMARNPERMRKSLQAGGVEVADLNTHFLSSPKRTGDSTLFYRLDTHWSPTGTLVAADAIKAEILGSGRLKPVLDATPFSAYSLEISRRKRPSIGRDLVDQLGKKGLNFAHEAVASVLVTRTASPADASLGQAGSPAIALVGSYYSYDWTGFADALRYTLQRDVLSRSAGAAQGSWVGIENYLREDAFQTAPPKLLIWEMPERDMRAPPDYKFRDSRSMSDNTEWLLRASAWAQLTCKPSSATAKIMPVGLATKNGSTSENDFIEIGFDQALGKLDYLSASAISDGSTTLRMEAFAQGRAARQLSFNVTGDSAAHALKTPLNTPSGGANKVRIYPGKSKHFSLRDVQVCRLPDDLLQ